MKKILVAVTLLLIGTQVFGQKYMTRNGHIWFFSKAPLENIEAHNNQTSAVIDGESGKLAFSLLIKGFEFEKALMQEHFNEKYMESDKYPKSTFEGQFTNADKINLKKNGTYNANVKGNLTIHGVTKEVEAPGTIEVKDGKITVKSTFPVRLKDYNITIPTVVKDKIAEVVDVHVDMAMDSK